ncbi:MAG: response regulator [Leptospiraceae bacterium]|nr:response regulator [Leptospiraceae bacterium]
MIPINIQNNKKLLLVEDEFLLAQLTKTSLENYGYTVIHVETGEEAIDLIQENTKVDLILMDIDLGDGISGTDAAKTILANHDIPLLFLSSHTEKEIVETTEKITSYGYVVKNSSVTVLDASIKMAFRLFEEKEKSKIIEKNLRTHEIELQMQNDEFRARQEELESLRAKYFEMYHLSPVGQLTLNEKGLIIESNLTARNILGVLADKLINQRFQNFIAKEDQDSYYLYKKKIIESNQKEQVKDSFKNKDTPKSCSFNLLHADGNSFPIHLTFTLTPKNSKESTYQLVIMK